MAMKKVFVELLEKKVLVYCLTSVEAKEDDTVLNWLRTETTYLTMLVRLLNQDRKESIKLQNGEL